MVDIDLYNELVSLSGWPVCQNYVPQADTDPHIYFQRSSTEHDYLLSGSYAESVTSYDIEVISLSADTTVSMAETIRTYFDGFYGTLGGTQVLGSFVSDQSDDYVYKGLNTDQNFQVTALRLELHT